MTDATVIASLAELASWHCGAVIVRKPSALGKASPITIPHMGAD